MAENENKTGIPSNRRKVLLVSLVLAILAVLLLYIYTKQLAARYGVAGDKVSVVVARYDLAADKPITNDVLGLMKIPESYVHPQAVFEHELANVMGQRVSHDIRANQPLLWSDFADPRTDKELTEVVKEGWRAIAIPVDRVNSMSGLLQPNNHVDILGTFMKPEQKTWVTITLLQNVTVLAVGNQLGSERVAQNSDPDRASRGYSTVTVLVTPEEAELLTFSVDKGKISLTLRNENDITTELALPPKDFDDVFGEKKRNEIQTKRNDSVTIIR